MKIRFPIILKIALLGLLVTSLGSGVALTISTLNQNKRSEETLIENIDKSLYSVDYMFEEGDNSQDLLEGLKNVKDYIKTVYSNPDIKEKTLKDFSSFEEYEKYFQERDSWVFPPPGAMIASPAYLEFRKNFKEISHILLEAHLSSGARAAYLCYEEEDGDKKRLIFMDDSRITYTAREEGSFYHLPGSHYDLKPQDIIIDEKNELYQGYKINTYLTRFIELTETLEDGTEAPVASLFLEYDRKEIQKRSMDILFSELIILGSVMVVVIMLYMLIAYFTITKNLKKLTVATDSISHELKQANNITPKKLEFRSHDEIASLASSFEVMEEEIVNYVNIIKKEAKENERREAELEVASNIQLSALPASSYLDENVELKAFIKPAKVVGGDFYDYFYHDDKFFLIIADVSGKGVPAALFMMKAKQLLKAKITSESSFRKAVAEVNNELALNNESSLFVTSFIARIDFEKEEICYINAGHEKPYILHNGEVIKVDGTANFVLGGMEDIEFEEETIKFEKGDTLLLFTDGLNESINDKQEEFSYERVENTFKESKDLSLEEKIHLFQQRLQEFVQNEEQFDDITIVTLKREDCTLSLRYQNKDYQIIEDCVNKFQEAFPNLEEEKKSKVGIALDELLNNIISYDESEQLEIDITFTKLQDDVKVTISHNGQDFNPFNQDKEVKIISGDEDLDSLNPGGYGVFLVQTLSKSQAYTYIKDHATITLIF